ncbi:hypothetical protein SAMN05660464_0902 [Geodermatophilus dictyosporus]|uniref:Uncharacterized protein n=1 Tax=Geodermatophilus dictyosporus TaxID=1523247 RepID=A0A1I5JNI8_9ACTN|nr:hypothetical protein [Geodermatophilus dictyosporus]SFO74348.1 hypothetical protein SAMN05660464_0902 [Geodermatophilus dictyosporus]
MSRAPDPLEPGVPAPGPRPDRGPVPARTWPRRLVHRLVLLDSWSPDTAHLGSPQAARRRLRDEWARSGDLAPSQAVALVALEETTAWSG